MNENNIKERVYQGNPKIKKEIKDLRAQLNLRMWQLGMSQEQLGKYMHFMACNTLEFPDEEMFPNMIYHELDAIRLAKLLGEKLHAFDIGIQTSRGMRHAKRRKEELAKLNLRVA